MLINWKSLAIAAFVFVTMLWIGLHNGSDKSYLTSELMMNAAPTRGCVAQRDGLCTLDIWYYYPAADLFVRSEEAYF